MAALDALPTPPESGETVTRMNQRHQRDIEHHATCKALYDKRMKEFPNDFARAYAAYLNDVGSL